MWKCDSDSFELKQNHPNLCLSPGYFEFETKKFYKNTEVVEWAVVSRAYLPI